MIVAALAMAAMAVSAAPAQAIHLFPLTPAFDPLGHDCAQALGEAPGTAGGDVAVAGFSFIDSESGLATTTVQAGESVTWSWLADHCHSVTFTDGSGTAGAPGFAPAQPQLVRHGEGESFTREFPEPGIYGYLCVHHASVGMQGTVVVE